MLSLRCAIQHYKFNVKVTLLHSYASNLFFCGIFQGIFTFASIFSLIRVVRPRFFYWRIALSSDNVLKMYNTPLRWFFAELRGFEAKVFTKLRIFDILKIRLNLYFWRNSPGDVRQRYIRKLWGSRHKFIAWIVSDFYQN